jgi:hypothetical protein
VKSVIRYKCDSDVQLQCADMVGPNSEFGCMMRCCVIADILYLIRINVDKLANVFLLLRYNYHSSMGFEPHDCRFFSSVLVNRVC